MASTQPQLGRALLTGLLLGLVATAGILSFFAWRELHVPCEFPGTPQCEFDTNLSSQIARLQLYGAAGFLLIATGLAIVLRRRPE